MSQKATQKSARKRAKQAQPETPKPQGESHDARPSHRHAGAPERMKLPNWPLLTLAVVGMCIAGYLSYTAWSGSRAAFCEAGGGCDVVQTSRWATFLGAPTAFWGFLTYAVLAYVALRVRRAAVHWQLAWLVALVGWGVSVYLTAVSVLALEATCAYCLASLGVLTAILALLVWQRPEGISHFAWPGWLMQTGAVAVVAVAGMHFLYSGVLDRSSGPEDPNLRGLAMRLSESGAKFYGAYWCPVCQRQKEAFTASQKRLPYVECSPGGPKGGSAPECIAAGVTSYPTWTFPNGDRNTGFLSVDELTRRVGYVAPQGAR
jgi:uncharacterized membrane protein